MKRKQAGFTLLEMLVVLAVFGLLMLGVALAMRFTGGLNAYIAPRMAAINELEPADRSLRALITSMRPSFQSDTDPPLDGTADGALFRAYTGDPAMALGRSLVQVRLICERGSLLLQTRPAPHVVRIGPAPRFESRALLTGLAGCRISYWDAVRQQWLTRWNSNDQLPALVRVHVEFPTHDWRRWPDIIAAPMEETRS